MQSIFWKNKGKAYAEEYCNPPSKLGRKHNLCFLQNIVAMVKSEYEITYAFDGIAVKDINVVYSLDRITNTPLIEELAELCLHDGSIVHADGTIDL